MSRVYSEDGTRGGGGRPLTDEEAAMLPAGWPRGVDGWNVDRSVADQLRQHPWTPEPAATTQPTAQPTSETVEELRRTLACLREEQEERMREIGSAAIRWGREHGYESAVQDFLPTIGLDPDVLDEETPVYEWEVVITVRGSGQRTDGSESGEDFFRQSLSLDEDWDEDGRAIRFGIDDDWEDVSLDTTYQVTSFTQA